ncbi:ion transporter [Planctobacterium marinum]|uniref:Potassium voltage gated channel, Shab-related subfamily, member 2 n=1 Tax=Planctobacterium marinum TaxID=1631968 RepID=A0AA48HIQ2_9ALTE|nr:potassium voltage gated channel, Shab-related subfamily, member 2 [Planctobacterium marinum]
MSLRQKTYNLLEKDLSRSLANKLLGSFIIVLIVANVIAVILESHQAFGQQYAYGFYAFNVFSVVIFTIEYLARVWVCVEAPGADASQPIKTRLRYMFSAVALVDFLAIAPFYLTFFINIDLRYLRMLRMLRLLKLTHYFKGLDMFVCVLRKELPTIGAAIFTVMVLVVMSASIMYAIEHQAQPEVFGSIPSAMWWAVVTMTTVGYGDVVPVTVFGKFIAMFIMLLGVGIVALPAAMLAAKFGDELRLRKQQLEAEVDNALSDGYVSKSERADLDQLAEQLDLSRDDLEQLIKNRTLVLGTSITCPHCKKAIKLSRHSAAE